MSSARGQIRMNPWGVLIVDILTIIGVVEHFFTSLQLFTSNDEICSKGTVVD